MYAPLRRLRPDGDWAAHCCGFSVALSKLVHSLAAP